MKEEICKNQDFCNICEWCKVKAVRVFLSKEEIHLVWPPEGEILESEDVVIVVAEKNWELPNHGSSWDKECFSRRDFFHTAKKLTIQTKNGVKIGYKTKGNYYPEDVSDYKK